MSNVPVLNSPVNATQATSDVFLPTAVHPEMSKRSCLVIYTGGTFGMTPDENGVLFPTNGFLERKIGEMDEFKYEGMPSITVHEWDSPIDSSDMNPDDWQQLAKDIERNYWAYDGFVVLMGTDTMAYAASALSFMLENLGKPVVFSGAMIPLHFPHSDARRNLIMSTLCAATLDIAEVCIYSNDKLMRANRTTKTANLVVDSFQSPNFPALAKTGVETIVENALTLPHPRRRFTTHLHMHTSVCVFHLVPGFSNDGIRGYIEQDHAPDISRAIVFALYGTGNAPLRKDAFVKLIKQAIDAGIAVVITSQCLYGRTKLDAYATGIRLLELGVITGHDMTIEACVTKLAYLMGKGMPISDLKRMMETNIRGELSLVSRRGDSRDATAFGIREVGSGKILQDMLGH